MPIERRKEGRPEYGLRNRATGPIPNGLMLIHVTAVGAAREIIRAGQINTRRCRVFERDLVYFFVLRPAYKPKNGREKRSVIDFFPFVFVFDSSHMTAPYHVYPFDTGGAASGAFDDAHSPYIPLDDYALEETLQGASDHIFWAFDTRADYYDGRLKPDLEQSLPAWDSHGHTFIEIARLAAEGSNMPDLRASSIEVAYARHAPLSPSLRFAVMPRQFLEDPQGNNTVMIDALQTLGVTWETYDWRPNRAPEEFHVEANRIVREWLASQSLL